MMPPTVDLFLLALRRVIQDNIDYVPPYESSGSLYIRPFVVGSGGQLGLSPAQEYYFCIFVNPVGGKTFTLPKRNPDVNPILTQNPQKPDYYKGGMGNPVKALISHSFDRAAPNGTGSVKLGGNYAPAFLPSNNAKTRGFAVMLFLDPREQKYIDEFATSNFAGLTKPDEKG